MGFDTLLGNTRLKENLISSLNRGHISHFYLISGPLGSGKHTLARLLAAAILCQGENRPCGRCGACRKVLENLHPDVITVEDREHKTVAVKIVRQFREDVFVLPNESDYKIYIFPQELGVEGQNALLKVLEEPPKYGVFLLLTDNPEKILPTVRSRCTELKLQALPEALLKSTLQSDFPDAGSQDILAAMVRSGGYLGQARQLLQEGTAAPPQTVDFVKALSAGDSLLLVQTLAPMEKWKRDELAQILGNWLEILETALACRSGGQAVSPLARRLASRCSSRDLHGWILKLRKARDYTLSNVSPGAVCGCLSHMLN